MWKTIFIIAAVVLWLLFCLRFWLLVVRRPTGGRTPAEQRHLLLQRWLIATAAGLGAGLIVILGRFYGDLTTLPSPSAAEAPPTADEPFRIQAAPASEPGEGRNLGNDD